MDQESLRKMPFDPVKKDKVKRLQEVRLQQNLKKEEAEIQKAPEEVALREGNKV